MSSSSSYSDDSGSNMSWCIADEMEYQIKLHDETKQAVSLALEEAKDLDDDRAYEWMKGYYKIKKNGTLKGHVYEELMEEENEDFKKMMLKKDWTVLEFFDWERRGYPVEDYYLTFEHVFIAWIKSRGNVFNYMFNISKHHQQTPARKFFANYFTDRKEKKHISDLIRKYYLTLGKFTFDDLFWLFSKHPTLVTSVLKVVKK